MNKSIVISPNKDVELTSKTIKPSPLLDNLILGFSEVAVGNGCTSNNCFSCINDAGDTDHCCCDSR